MAWLPKPMPEDDHQLISLLGRFYRQPGDCQYIQGVNSRHHLSINHRHHLHLGRPTQPIHHLVIIPIVVIS